MAAPFRTAKKLVLGAEIKYMIENSETRPGLSHSEVGKLIEVSPSKITMLTNGFGTISAGDLRVLAQELGFRSETYINDLLEIRRESGKRGLWSTGHNRFYSEDLRLLIDLERNADWLRYVGSEVVPGIAQHEDYIRALHVGLSDRDGITVEDQIQARLARQAALMVDTPPEMNLILSESCLLAEYGSRETMRAQADHLIELSERDHVLLQIMPFRAKSRRSAQVMSTPFTLARVPSPGIAGPLEIAYTAGQGGAQYLDDKNALKEYEIAWSGLSAAALTPEDSQTFIKHVKTTYR